ncbi:MAG: DUF6588 family protein [Elusimicrobiales bacterium]
MKKISLLVSLFLSFSFNLFADPFEDFKTYFSQSDFKAFVKDFGGVLGANDFNSGRALGFPGFDIGFDMAIQKEPASGNKILKNAGVKSFGIPMVHGSVGIPLTGLDFTLRGFSYSGLNIIGGGLRYNIFKSGMITKFMPDLSAMLYYDKINYDYFKGSHISLDIVGSWDIPIVKPFAGIGIDKTKLEIDGITGFDGIDESASGSRYTLGVKFSPLPLVYLYGAYSIIHSEKGYNFGLGVRF